MNTYKITNPTRLLLAGILIVVLAVVSFLGIGALSQKQDPAVASINAGQSYSGTTTYNGAGAPSVAKDIILKTGTGTFGSVVITGAVAGTITVYDGTSTNPALTTLAASSTIATFPASTAAGTYTFDKAFYNGLIVSFSSATALPTSTITWR